MSGFASVAKSLISQTAAPRRNDVGSKLDNLQIACDAGFSPREIFRDLQELKNDCGDEDKVLKKGILELMIKVHGLLTPDELQRAAPSFTIVIQGDNARVNNMLCPNFTSNS